MECIYCGHDTKVVNSRPKKADKQVWRRRQCLSCHAITTSNEFYPLEDALRVEKKNGSFQPFYRDKIFLSVFKATDHLPNNTLIAHDLTATVLRHIIKQTPLDVVVSSQTIAKEISRVLKRYNAAAAVRYLSFQTNLQLPNDVRKTFKK